MLLIIFLSAQTLGWMHRSVHGADRQVLRAAGLHAAAAQGAHPAPHAHSVKPRPEGVAGLFTGHDDAAVCQLFDAVTHPGCAPAATLAFSPGAPPAMRPVSHSHFIARWAALFDARGPPVLRA